MIDVLQFCAAMHTLLWCMHHLEEMDMSTVMYNQDCADLCRLTSAIKNENQNADIF
jgi:hypothetical protein